MVSVGSTALIAVAIVSCVSMAWALGASSNSPPFAPAIGANAIATIRAALLIGILAALGAVIQGGSISETIGSHLIRETTITPLAAIAGLLTAAAYIVSGVYTGYPIPAAFATTGAMIGVGLSRGGAPAVDTYRAIAGFWLMVPVVSGGLAYLTATLLRRDDVPETVGVPLLAGAVAGALAHVRLGVIPAPSERARATIAGFVARRLGRGYETVAGIDLAVVAVTLCFAGAGFWLLRRRTKVSVDRGIRSFLLLLGGIVAFSSGGSQVGLATGPLEHLFEARLGLPSVVLLGIGAVGILLGAWMGSPRLLQATAREYAELGVRRSIAALVPGFLITQAAIALGIPISFNNIIISSVVGSGLAAGSAGVSRSKLLATIAFWIVTLVTSVFVGFTLYRALSVALGIQ